MPRRPTPLSTPTLAALRAASPDELEAEVARLRRRVEDEVALRDELLAIASHELRTPLQVVTLHLDAIHRAAVNAQVTPASLAERVRKMQAQLGHAVALVERILDAAALDGGGGALGEREEVDLVGLAGEILDENGDALARAGCTATLNAARPTIVMGDRARLQQAIANLVVNAMKYGAGAPIEITVAALPTQRRALVSVRDHGVGISPDDHARVFEKYARGVGARGQPGIGLGLWITRRLVEAHGGMLLLESELGGGATFTIELPLVR
jgi:signal transduction histidine kinase